MKCCTLARFGNTWEAEAQDPHKVKVKLGLRREF